MTEIEALAKQGYEAYTKSLTAPGSGAPPCFSPLHWLELEGYVRQSFIHATGKVQSLYTTGASVNWATFAHEQYRLYMLKFKQAVPPWEKLTTPLRNAWIACTETILSTFKTHIN